MTSSRTASGKAARQGSGAAGLVVRRRDLPSDFILSSLQNLSNSSNHMFRNVRVSFKLDSWLRPKLASLSDAVLALVTVHSIAD